ncbi:HEAT repeat domain-containing protein [Paenibacillus caui]|uniref:HEAT repeat domain-containing protein n=1 Tax=Paenibacillus caui TaxID=2873927 RepID=UPI001CAA19B0|nr:HEAT repeat domain-containing protein [Paenibacillus caui]
MHTSEQVIPYLQHDDSIVSNGAIQYFAETFNYADGIMKLLLSKLRSSANPDQTYLHMAYQFPQTSSTVAEIMDMLRSGSVKGNARVHLAQILLNSAPTLLEPVLESLQTFSPETAAKAEEHIRIGQLNQGELKAAFEQMLAASRGLDYGDLEFDYLDYLVNEIVKKQAISSKQVMKKLDGADPADPGNYEAVYYAQLAGKMKLSAAVPILIEYLAADNDLLAEQACDALVRIGTEDVITRLAARYETEQDDYFKLYAADCLGRIPLPSAEMSVIRLLQKEKNLTHATKLAGSLCFMGSKQSIPVVAKLIEAGYDNDFLDLREPLYINCVLNGVSLPQLEGWRRTFL